MSAASASDVGAMRRVVIASPCPDLDEAVSAAMRLAPQIVEFTGFDAGDAVVSTAVAKLRQTGHRVVMA